MQRTRLILIRHAESEANAISSLPRPRRTADAVSEAIGLPVQVDHALREFDLGEWEGRTFAELENTENLSKRWDADSYFTPPGGESPYLLKYE